MEPAGFAAAAMALMAGAPEARVPGLAQPLTPALAGLARLAGGCDRLFLARPPLAPGAVICGASHAPAPGGRAHAAGLGPDARAAWTRAMGEVAEARALCPLPQDPCGVFPLLDARLRPCGTFPAAQALRLDPGDPVSGIAAGADVAQAARAAWHEAVERHAIALWLGAAAPARPLDPPRALRVFEAALRGAAAVAPLRYLRLPGAVPGFAVVVALSQRPEGVVPGYGCAPDPLEAACKAATEVVQGEFALHLEQRAQAEQGGPLPKLGFTARAQALAGRPDLTHPAPGGLAPGPAVAPVFAVLTRPDDGVPVLRVMAEGLLTPPPGAV